MKNQFWTDYPFVELGDISGKIAPVREVKLIEYDGNKYCKIKVVGTDLITEIKSGYLYKEEGRYGEVPNLTAKEILRWEVK